MSQAIWPYSGHYLPTEDNFNEFISFLKDNEVDLTNVKVIELFSSEGKEINNFERIARKKRSEISICVVQF